MSAAASVPARRSLGRRRRLEGGLGVLLRVELRRRTRGWSCMGGEGSAHVLACTGRHFKTLERPAGLERGMRRLMAVISGCPWRRDGEKTGTSVRIRVERMIRPFQNDKDDNYDREEEDEMKNEWIRTMLALSIGGVQVCRCWGGCFRRTHVRSITWRKCTCPQVALTLGCCGIFPPP